MALEDRVKWVERADKNQNPLDFFRQYYDSSTTRGKLSKQDHSLYQRLRREGLLDQIPLQQEHRDFGTDPMAYYQEHYVGLTRGQLRQQDHSLYERLRREGLLDNVPTKSRKSR